MSTIAKAKAGAGYIGAAMLILLGWCLMMILYFWVYDAFESKAVPVKLGLREFSTDMWNQGYFHAKGSLRNESAEEDGDRMLPGVTDIWCSRLKMTCTVAIATVFDGYLDLDVTPYDVETWNDRIITFSDSTSMCANLSYVIDRVGQTYNFAVRKKPIVPDYAARSPLHPCDSKIDKNVSLISGLQVYKENIDIFERRNGLYFHLLLIVLNAMYLVTVIWLWRRVRRRRAAAPIAADV